jgi:hypothetical protein
MSHDYKQKEPSKTEKMLYQLAMAQNQMEKGLWSTSTVVMALAVALKVSAKDIAKLMVSDVEIKAFSQEVNDEIKKLEGDKHQASHKATSDSSKDHNHTNAEANTDEPKEKSE